jgi:hypothetical protein
MDVGFRDLIDTFIHIGGTHAIVANINFQEKEFNFKHTLQHIWLVEQVCSAPPQCLNVNMQAMA